MPSPPEPPPRAQDLPSQAVRTATWEAVGAPEPVSQVVRADDAVAYLGLPPSGPPVLHALDATTGAVRFSVPLPDLAETARHGGDHVVGGADGSVTVAGAGAAGRASSVSTYDRSGRLRWRTSAPGFPVVTTAAGVLVSDGTHGRVTTSLLDLASGSLRWSADLGTVVHATGATVVSLDEVRGDGGEGRPYTRATSLRSGRLLWTVGRDRATGAVPAAALDDAVVLRSSRSGRAVLAVHDASSGAERGTLDVADASGATVHTDPDTGTVVVQTVADERLYGFSLDRPTRPLWTATDAFTAFSAAAATGAGLFWQAADDGFVVRDVRTGEPAYAGTASAPVLAVGSTWIDTTLPLSGEQVHLDRG